MANEVSCRCTRACALEHATFSLHGRMRGVTRLATDQLCCPGPTFLNARPPVMSPTGQHERERPAGVCSRDQCRDEQASGSDEQRGWQQPGSPVRCGVGKAAQITCAGYCMPMLMPVLYQSPSSPASTFTCALGLPLCRRLQCIHLCHGAGRPPAGGWCPGRRRCALLCLEQLVASSSLNRIPVGLDSHP